MTVSDVLSSTQSLGKSVLATAALMLGLSSSSMANATTINALPGSLNLAPNFSVLSMPFVSDTTVETFLGLGVGELDSLFGVSLVSGTAFKNDWALGVGDTLSFDFTWVDAGWADSFALITVDGAVVSAIDAGSSYMVQDVFSWQAASAGTYEVGVGMVSNQYWPLSGSGLMAFNYQVVEAVTSDSNAVPVPSTLLLMGLGLVLVPTTRKILRK
jgi:hypothetical protein